MTSDQRLLTSILVSAVAFFAVVAGSVWFGYNWRDNSAAVELANCESRFKAAELAQTKALSAKEREYRQKETAWSSAFDQINKEGTARVEKLESDLRASSAASKRLQQRVDALLATVRAGAPQTPATPGVGGSAEEAAVLLAVMSREFEAAAGEAGEFAERSYAALISCRESYSTAREK